MKKPLLLALALTLTTASQAQDFFKTLNQPHVLRAETIAEQIWQHTKAGTIKVADPNGIQKDINRYGGSFGVDSYSDPNRIVVQQLGQWFLHTPYKARNYSVCGVLVTHMLRDSYNWNWANYASLNQNMQVEVTTSPNARQYKQLIDQGKGFVKINFLNQIQPGDILSIDYRNGATNDSNVPTGHVMMVRRYNGIYRTTTKSNFQNGVSDAQWAVTQHQYRIHELDIVDSTSVPHDTDYDSTDSRRFTRLVNNQPVQVAQSGIGVGKFYVVTDLNNNIRGYGWKINSLPTHSNGVWSLFSQGQNQTDRPMSFGRLIK